MTQQYGNAEPQYFIIVSTDVTASQTAMGLINDVTVHINNSAATVAQIQAALTSISTFIGGMGAAGATLGAYAGQSGN